MVNFEQVEAAASQAREPVATLLAAGSTAVEANGDSDANVCSYAEAYRKAARGGAYVVIVADFPQPSLYVSLSTHGRLCNVSWTAAMDSGHL